MYQIDTHRFRAKEFIHLSRTWRLSLAGLFLAVLIFHSASAEPPKEIMSRKTAPPGGNIRVLVVPVLETTLSSELDARIERIRVNFGDSFKQGEPLIVFDDDIYKAELRKVEAELKEARETLEVNKRLQNLRSVSDLEVAVSEARMEKAQAELELNKAVLRKCIIKAPFSGRVVKRSANPFEYVPKGRPLLNIIDNVNLNLQFFIPSMLSRRIKKGQRFRVHIDETGKNYTAQVISIGAKLDSVSQSLELRARIDGKHPELISGMSGTARLFSGQR